ncbi:DUF2946 domain-containing protein [Yersinia massiliensis]|uniref:DUF2946 domain-containing protein n=2 Tax=Yersinia massiliensis TaxID=419257 RepID=A0AA91BAB4_9GAMM|nr:DUF2946 domain-containing protein [Yersinia massiliensis]MDA5549182.1 DUF2946 domain-containing protein [Yersinia massiliensis]NIL28044.1 DUF2946 domain-containing protein [Yersinia massiliensis]
MPLSQLIHRRRRYSAWLGIAAILMLFIAPVISVSLAISNEQNTSAITMVDCAMADGVKADRAETDHEMAMYSHHGGGHDGPPDGAHSQTKTTNTHEQGSHHDSMMMNHAACGYCVLLTHLPLLNTAFKADIRSAHLLAEPSPPRLIPTQVVNDRYCECQPRAPPTSYS